MPGVKTGIVPKIVAKVASVILAGATIGVILNT